MTNRARRRFGSRSAAAWAVTAALAATLASAQDDARPDQLKKRYADALAQLKQSQDRKNQLAADNERLTAKLADLQKQLDAANGRIATLKAAADGFDERTFFLRSHYAAWRAFVAADPTLKRHWDAYLRGDAESVGPGPLAWPFPTPE
jgi:septal ring factor EnvC (AmiA/AmiB activator)